MVEQDKKRFAEVMTLMGTVYGKEISVEQMRAWFELLADCEVADLEVAAKAHMRESRFMPTPAELLDRLNPKANQRAMLAWAEVPRLLRNSRAAKSEDPVTERVVQDLGGWFALGQKTAAELVWVEKEFVQRYEMYAELGLEVKAISGPRQGMIGVAQALLKPPGG